MGTTRQEPQDALRPHWRQKPDGLLERRVHRSCPEAKCQSHALEQKASLVACEGAQVLIPVPHRPCFQSARHNGALAGHGVHRLKPSNHLLQLQTAGISFL
eukprot:4414617-Lingulodinium_polyedra.AAC.1